MRVKPVDPNRVATDNAMSAFRVAMRELQAGTPQVDAAGIRAPYEASKVATGQLGTGLQQALLQGGQAAQSQYASGLGEAQKTAAQFGISAGAGAAPTALQGNGAQLIAQQTQAQAAAAPMASTAWQQALERAAGAKIADATLSRSNLIASGSASLAGSLPGAISNEKQLGFQQDTAKKNFALAVGTAKDRATNDLRDYLLGITKVQTSAATSAENARIKRQALAQKSATDKAKLAQGNTKLAQGQQSLEIKKRASTASAKGLKGISGAVKALSGTSTSGAKPITGYKVTYLADPEGISAGGPPVTLTVKDPNTAQPPSGYIKPKSVVGQPVYGQAGSKTTKGISRSQWDTQMRALLAQNPGQAAAIKAFLGPRPKK